MATQFAAMFAAKGETSRLKRSGHKLMTSRLDVRGKSWAARPTFMACATICSSQPGRARSVDYCQEAGRSEQCTGPESSKRGVEGWLEQAHSRQEVQDYRLVGKEAGI
jgi:hypothetical protein